MAGQTVLVLENHPCLLLFSVGLVEDAGYVALPAEDVRAAAGLLERHGEIEVAFADLDAPGCDALLTDMRARWPNIRLVLTATGLAASSARIPEGAMYFQKPFTPIEIETTLLAYTS